MLIRAIIFLLLCQSVSAVAQPGNESSYLIDLHKKKFTWLIGRNYDSLHMLMDEKVLYIHSNAMIETKGEVIDNLKNDVISYTKSDVLESSARIFGNTAVVTGKGIFAGKVRGTAFELNLLYTEVYSKIGSRWKLVSRHACRLPA